MSPFIGEDDCVHETEMTWFTLNDFSCGDANRTGQVISVMEVFVQVVQSDTLVLEMEGVQ